MKHCDFVHSISDDVITKRKETLVCIKLSAAMKEIELIKRQTWIKWYTIRSFRSRLRTVTNLFRLIDVLFVHF